MRLKKSQLVIILFVLFSVLYVLQTLLVKPDPASLSRYHITATQARELSLTIIIPYIIIWAIAVAGFLRLDRYSRMIAGSRDGQAFARITTGVLWLSLGLPVTTVLGSFISHQAAASPGSAAALIRLNNYVDVLIVVIAMIAIYQGSRILLSFVRSKDIASANQPFLVANLLFITFSAFYVMLVLHDPARQLPADGVRIATYYQPDWLIVSTIVVPRLLSWYLGVRAALNIALYRRKVKGSLYKLSLRSLAAGVAGITVGFIVLRGLQTISVTLSHWGIGLLLLLIYGLLIVISIGYIFIARGAKSLQRLEEI